MARSLKKGPFVHFKLEKKVLANVEASKKSVIKTLIYTVYLDVEGIFAKLNPSLGFYK